jgi:hypothetical protein
MANVFEQIERAMHAAMDAGRAAVANDNEGLPDTPERPGSDGRAGAVCGMAQAQAFGTAAALPRESRALAHESQEAVSPPEH